MSDAVLENLRQELRRGSLILAVLSALREEQYGYTLRKELAAAGVEIEESALYPMLRRLESQGLLTSAWREEASRNKRFYHLSTEGKAVLAQLTDDWRALNASLDRILTGDARGDQGRGPAQSISERRRRPAAKG
jgi:DNA-binding PadR family transcriptional regulator